MVSPPDGLEKPLKMGMVWENGNKYLCMGIQDSSPYVINYSDYGEKQTYFHSG